MSELDMIMMNEQNQKVLDDIMSTMYNVDHLESILIKKKKQRKHELDTIRKDLDNSIRAYSNIVLKLLS